MTADISRPIVLIGAARSGTKFLRDVLSSGTGTACVPYDVNYIWRYGHHRQADDRLDPESLTPAQRAFIHASLARISGGRPNDTLIEKTVANTLRVPYVERVFPDARYVHLVRDGRDVVESAMRQWTEPPDLRALTRKLREIPLRNMNYVLWYATNAVGGVFKGRKGGRVWGPRYPGIRGDLETRDLVEICALQWQNCVSMASRDLAAVPRERVFEVRYEDIVADPSRLRALVADLELPGSHEIMRDHAERVRANRSERWRSLAPTDRQAMDAIIGETRSELGYGS